MSHTLTISLPDELAQWLEDSAARAGVSEAQIITEQLERARDGASSKTFMRLAGTVDGDPDLSSRKGFSGPAAK